MRRYLVERTFGDPGDDPVDWPGAVARMIACNADRGVTWIHSYISSDGRTSYCLYDAPSPEAIRLTARANGLPVDRIVEVQVLDPYPFPK
jgi:hypothetical protein